MRCAKMQNLNQEPPSNYDLVLGFLQIFDVLLNVSQVSNDVLLKELQKQDDHYFDTIIKQNNRILELLEAIKERLDTYENK